jgi:hypothetical protein
MNIWIGSTGGGLAFMAATWPLAAADLRRGEANVLNVGAWPVTHGARRCHVSPGSGLLRLFFPLMVRAGTRRVCPKLPGVLYVSSFCSEVTLLLSASLGVTDARAGTQKFKIYAPA